MKLIYIKSTMEPKDYATIRSILKQEQGEKIAPYVFKLIDTSSLEKFLKRERITFEVYCQEGTKKKNNEVLTEKVLNKPKITQESRGQKRTLDEEGEEENKENFRPNKKPTLETEGTNEEIKTSQKRRFEEEEVEEQNKKTKI